MSWDTFRPWFLTAASTIVLISIAYFLYDNVMWFRATTFNEESTSHALVFRLHVHHLHIAMVKRSIGLLAGFSLVFLGLAVAFHHVQSMSGARLQTPALAVEAVSASPGILAVVLGVVLLGFTIGSKDSFPPYLGEGEVLGVTEGERKTEYIQTPQLNDDLRREVLDEDEDQDGDSDGAGAGR